MRSGSVPDKVPSSLESLCYIIHMVQPTSMYLTGVSGVEYTSERCVLWSG